MSELCSRIAEVLQGPRAAPAIQFRGCWTSRGEIADIVAGIEKIINALGLPAWAPIGCVLRNRPEHAAAMTGVVGGGHCLMTFNALAPDDRLASELADARLPVVIAAAEDWQRDGLRQAVAATGGVGIALSAAPPWRVERVAGLQSLGRGPHRAAMPGIAILMQSSGTTGLPKRIPISLAALERQLMDAASGGRHGGSGETAPIVAAQIGIMSASLVHIAGVWGVLGPAMSGRPICLLERFTLEDWRAAVVEHRPRMGSLPPTALRMLLDAQLPREDLASLVAIGAGSARLDPGIVDAFMHRYAIPVLSNYGATEFAGGVASWSLSDFRQYWQSRRGAAGRLHRGIEARTVDPATGAVLPEGADGVLELRGFVIADGSGWVRTTDRAVIDADRFLWITGRIDNVVNRGGFKVSADEVAVVLERHPAIREACVVGIPDRRLGEVPVAALVLAAGATRPGDAELANWVRAALLPYCVPTQFRFLDDLPRTPSLKVALPAIRALFPTPAQDEAGTTR